MRKFRIRNFAFCALLLALGLFGTLAPRGEAASLEIVNEVTDAYEEVPGTGAYFLPMAGMAPSSQFDGFVSAASKAEVVVVSIKKPFAEIAEGFTDMALKARGVQELSRSALTINGADALLIKALHPDGSRNVGKWILLLADGRTTLVVNGMFPGGDAETSKGVESMLKSVVMVKDDDLSSPEGTGDSPGAASESE